MIAAIEPIRRKVAGGVRIGESATSGLLMLNKDPSEALRLVGRQPISIDDFQEISARAGAVVDRVREAMLAPYGKKAAPTFSSASISALTGLDIKQVDYRTNRSLRQPPRGYHWVRNDGGDYLLAAIAGGLIAQVILNSSR